MKNHLILTFDCGTQSIRCTLVDKNGNIVGMATQRTKECFALERGWAEQNADEYAVAICEVAQKLKNQCGDLWGDIIAVTSTAVRDTNVCMDKNGKAIRPIIMWLDQREAEFNYKQVPLFNRLLLRIVGMTETAKKQGKVTAANWIRENEPENWKNTYKYMTISGYINHLMTGRFIESKACQAAHIPYHYKKRRWKSTSDIQWKIFNVDKEKLYDLVEPGEILGYITEEFSQKSGIKQGLPVVIINSNQEVPYEGKLKGALRTTSPSGIEINLYAGINQFDSKMRIQRKYKAYFKTPKKPGTLIDINFSIDKDKYLRLYVDVDGESIELKQEVDLKEKEIV
ncbi:MAG: hypothetical protein IKV34_04125 [Clostridia bacterium]|nr:hypothetical protein [Clostridia bacterium]